MTATIRTPHIQNGKRSPLDDDLRRARLRGFIDGEAQEGDWWAVIRMQDGKLLCRNGRSYEPPPHLKDWAKKTCEAINDEVHYNGAWTVVIFKNEHRWAFIWKDWDGDLQIFADEDSSLHLVERVPVQRMVEHADEMIVYYLNAILHDVEVKPEQQVKLAAGEKPTTQVAPSVLMH